MWTDIHGAPGMSIDKLAHFSVRTSTLQASRDFYCQVLGFREGFRPDFPFPGVWLYLHGDKPDDAVVHLIGAESGDSPGLKDYLGDKQGEALRGSAAVDHLAFFATDLRGMRERLDAMEIEFAERTVPTLGLHQLFVKDPSGVTIELTFPAGEAQAEASSSGGAR
jgi:catechol 2,3-dioxygenase-like lactoylglutathione lyase family enzyme